MTVDLSWCADAQWEDITAPITNGADNRSAEAYVRTIGQFPVETHKRYAPMPLITWCNIFAGDCARAMSVWLPHWIRGFETRANDLALWLEHRLSNGGLMQGPEHGWIQMSQSEAVKRANAGHPTVVSWLNPVPSKPGHIAFVLPSGDGSVQIAQAGRTCFAYGSLAMGFGHVSHIKFFTHS